MDITVITDGAFMPRTTEAGPPTAFSMEGMQMIVHRGQDTTQRIDAASVLGAVALCTADGTVLGYGSCDVDDIAGFADRVDALMGMTAGEPLARLAAHKLHLALPLDAMPNEVRDMFLTERVDMAILSMTMLDDETVRQTREMHLGQHDHGQCSHGEDISGDDLETARDDIDLIIGVHGHGCVASTSMGVPRTYTVGLAEGGWPELVITGLLTQGMEVLNLVVTALRSRDMKPRDGVEIIGALGIPVRLHALRAEDARWAPIAVEKLSRSMAGSHVELMQVVWPDGEGRFPGQDGYDETLIQPMLDEED